MSGTAGEAPDGGLDLLAYWVNGAHSRGLQLHARINPYRITRDGEAEWACAAGKQSGQAASGMGRAVRWELLF